MIPHPHGWIRSFAPPRSPREFCRLVSPPHTDNLPRSAPVTNALTSTTRSRVLGLVAQQAHAVCPDEDGEMIERASDSLHRLCHLLLQRFD